MGQGYRDEVEAARARLRILGEEIAAREARVTPLFWRQLPGPLAAEVDALREGCEPRDASLEALLAALAARERRLAAMDRALARLPDIETAWHALPDRVPLPRAAEPPAWIPDFLTRFEEMDRLGALVAAIAQRHDPAPVLPASRSVARRAEFRANSAPFVLQVQAFRRNRNDGPWVTVATSVSAATARLRVRPEGGADGLLKAIRLRRDVATGDPAFDHWFFVEGHRAAVAVLLSAPARAALLEIAREDVPTLEVSAGLARLDWRFDPTPASVDAAVRALAAIRAAPPTVRLRS